MEARFVEVKSARDRLMDTQHVWVDILVRGHVTALIALVKRPQKSAQRCFQYLLDVVMGNGGRDAKGARGRVATAAEEESEGECERDSE